MPPNWSSHDMLPTLLIDMVFSITRTQDMKKKPADPMVMTNCPLAVTLTGSCVGNNDSAHDDA